MMDGMKQAQRLTHVRGAAAVGVYLLFSSLLFSFLFWFGLSPSLFHLSAGMKGSGGGAPPSSPLAQRRRGYWVLLYSDWSAYSMNKTKTKRCLSLLRHHSHLHFEHA